MELDQLIDVVDGNNDKEVSSPITLTIICESNNKCDNFAPANIIGTAQINIMNKKEG